MPEICDLSGCGAVRCSTNIYYTNSIFLVTHFSLMAEQHDDFACLMFRKFAAWYGARLGIPEDLEDRLRRFESFAEFDEIVEQIRRRHGERQCEIPTALIKVPNGPVEHW